MVQEEAVVGWQLDVDAIRYGAIAACVCLRQGLFSKGMEPVINSPGQH